ncbi:hypothetical protein SEA_KEELAN_26 [Gordonia phage Keelan]|nr:hypothetical protein SEA_KEELAN_26 [Gordonia phage Keelan]
MSKKQAEVYENAADFLEKNNWGKGEYYDPATESYCALGAVGAAKVEMGLNPVHPLSDASMGWKIETALSGRDIRRLRSHLGKYIGDSELAQASGTAGWNDRPERTKQEVLDFLRFAAKEEMKAEN